MKQYLIKALKWALNKLEPTPAWDFPAVSKDFNPRPKAKPRAKKATTVAKKATPKKTVKK